MHCVFSCDKQLKKWHCHSACVFVCPFFFSVLGGLSSPKEFQWCFKKVVRVFEVSRMVPLCFKGSSKKIECCSKIPSRVIQGSFKVIWKKFKGCFKAVSKTFQGVSRVFKEVSSVFQENLKRSFKGVSKMFQWSFAILFFYGSHRSYPSKRRACFISLNLTKNLPLDNRITLVWSVCHSVFSPWSGLRLIKMVTSFWVCCKRQHAVILRKPA